MISPEVKKKGNQFFMAICKEWGLNPVAEFLFAEDEGRKFRTDYYFEENGVRVALEVEGGVYGAKGGHTSIVGFKKDIVKYNLYSLKGIFLYRVQPEDLIKTKTFEDLKKILRNGKGI